MRLFLPGIMYFCVLLCTDVYVFLCNQMLDVCFSLLPCYKVLGMCVYSSVRCMCVSVLRGIICV